MYRFNLICLAGLTGLACLLGCGGGTVDLGTVPAGGKVTLDGQPVAGAKVAFSPESAGGKAAVAMTDDAGAFKLMTDGMAEGALPGSYTVTVFKTAAAQSTGPGMSYDEMTPEQLEEAGRQVQEMQKSQDSAKAEDLLPEKYKSPTSSGLTVEVPAGGKTDIILELTSK